MIFSKIFFQLSGIALGATTLKIPHFSRKLNPRCDTPDGKKYIILIIYTTEK